MKRRVQVWLVECVSARLSEKIISRKDHKTVRSGDCSCSWLTSHIKWLRDLTRAQFKYFPDDTLVIMIQIEHSHYMGDMHRAWDQPYTDWVSFRPRIVSWTKKLISDHSLRKMI